MATSISRCRGCAHPVILFYRGSLQTFKPSNPPTTTPRWLQPTLARISGRSYATARTKPTLQKQIPKTTSPPPKATVAPLGKSLQSPRLGYAQQLADKTYPTILYEAGPNKVFLFSSYMAGLFCMLGAGAEVWFNVYNAPDGSNPAVRITLGVTGVFLAAVGTRFALMPAGAIRSIKILPARAAKASSPAARTASASASSIPVRLEIEARRNAPFPFLPLRRFEADPNDIVMKAPMYNRKTVPSDYEKMVLKQEEVERRKKEREYEMSHLMTAPFRHAGQVISMLFVAFRRGITGEGFAPITIGDIKYKLDITSAYALEEGRALDRIVRIEEDPAIARLASKAR